MFVCEEASIRPLSQLYLGPFKVLARSGKFITMQLGTRTDTISINCLKPVHSPDPVPQQPPRLGRPPGHAPARVPVLPTFSNRRNPPRHAHTAAPSPLHDAAGGELL